MVIAGAGGHAREMLGILAELDKVGNVAFFDDYGTHTQTHIFGKFPILKNQKEAEAYFLKNPSFALGVGNPSLRQRLEQKLLSYGGKLESIISPKANIGSFEVVLQPGLNILTNATITQSVTVGKGALLHINTILHHDVVVGDYAEISPGAIILGNAKVGSFCRIGAGAIILPGVEVADHAVVGAGAVVTKNVTAHATVKGVPAH
jgi:sugar O-acyltransferase (sialic acid O-acetyltransferase NeuD family)